MGGVFIPSETANTTGLPCKNGHVGQWVDQTNRVNEEGRAYVTRRCGQCGRDRARTHIYGMSNEAFEQLKQDQPLCAICGSDGSDCGAGILEIDHDHSTGEVRGLLCRRCNMFLGFYESRRSFLPAVEKYLNG